MKRIQKIAIGAGCILIAVFILFCFISNSKFYLEWRIRNAKDDFRTLVAEESAELSSIAQVFYKSAAENNIDLSYDKYRNNLPESTLSQVKGFLAKSPAKIDEIYVGGHTKLVYPENVCVFRKEIRQRKEIYAWVDLIYAPSTVEVPEKWIDFAEHPAPDWFIVVSYGY